MRRLELMLVLLVALVALPFVALADHVNEPTHPITKFELTVERYDTNEQVDCNGGIASGRKLRIQPIAESDTAWASGVPGHHDPSEHFSTGWQLDRRATSWKGVVSWTLEERTVWPHSNIPGDTDSKKFNVAYATIDPDESNGGSSTNLSPGIFRLRAALLADVSGGHFVEVCAFTVI